MLESNQAALSPLDGPLAREIALTLGHQQAEGRPVPTDLVDATTNYLNCLLSIVVDGAVNLSDVNVAPSEVVGWLPRKVVLSIEPAVASPATNGLRLPPSSVAELEGMIAEVFGDSLNERTIKVFARCAHGYTVAAAAAELYIAKTTAWGCVETLLERFELTSVRQLAATAFRALWNAYLPD